MIEYLEKEEYTFEAFFPNGNLGPVTVKIDSFYEGCLIISIPDNETEKNNRFLKMVRKTVKDYDFGSGTAILTCRNKKDQWQLFDISPKSIWLDNSEIYLFSNVEVIWKFNKFRYNLLRYSLIRNVVESVMRLF